MNWSLNDRRSILSFISIPFLMEKKSHYIQLMFPFLVRVSSVECRTTRMMYVQAFVIYHRPTIGQFNEKRNIIGNIIHYHR